jgi:polysaccharide export outer membrane protein
MLFKRFVIFTFLMLASTAAFAQEDRLRPVGQQIDNTSNLPVQRIGKDDLLGVQVYDSPELTRTVRVLSDGNIRLPMMKEKIHAEGLFPADVEILIADELKSEELLVEPFVTVTVAEYHSRPISVNGAVKSPTIFQAVGTVNLLDAIAKAGGFDKEAGGELIITRPNGDTGVQSIQRVPVKALIDGSDQTLNVKLSGGEVITVPVAAMVVVTGNLKVPGIYPVQDSGTTTVMTAIAQAQGLGEYSPSKAYVYRNDAQGQRHEIEIDLKAIKQRKKPDVVLQARDVLYIPDNTRAKRTDQVINAMAGVGTSAATALVYTRHQ